MSYRKVSQIAVIALVGMLLACGPDSAPLTEPDVGDLTGLDAAKGGNGGGKGGPGSGATYTLELFINNVRATSVATGDLTGPEPVTILSLNNLLLPGEITYGDGNHLATCQNFVDYFRGNPPGQEPGKLGAGWAHDGMFIHGDLVNFGIGDLSDAYHALALGPYDLNTASEAGAPMATIDPPGVWPPAPGGTTTMSGTRIKFKGGKRVTKNGGCGGGGWTHNDWYITVKNTTDT